jgi:RNA recognition motif-containing protein
MELFAYPWTALIFFLQSGKSKGYALIEFQDEEVAKIAASTMHNYLMFHKILKCKLSNTACSVQLLFFSLLQVISSDQHVTKRSLTIVVQSLPLKGA